MIKITSRKNDKIKELIKFRNKNGKTAKDLILVEGEREIERAIAAGIKPLEIYFCADLLIKNRQNSLLNNLEKKFKEAYFYDLPIDIFESIAYKNNPFGILMMAKFQAKKITDIKLPKNPACLICDNIEKPGNLGALLRTADGVGLDAVYQTGSLSDYRNPNVVRASTGTIFSLNFAQCDAKELIAYLKKNRIRIVAADPDAKIIYSELDYKKSYALVVGAEDKGLSQIFLDNADYLVKIPMLGAADSLNVHQAATVILFEALRQRGFRK
jgi:TrmH family RNA methyltransferase